MPVTFPSHAAAAWPLARVAPKIPVLALIVGSAAPDLSYALNFGGEVAHRPRGLLDFALPVGLFFYAWAEWVLLPVLRSALPTAFGIQWGRLVTTRGPPQDAAGWAWAALGIVLGAATHLLWDGFTHRDQWPSTLLYPETIVAHLGSRPLYLANLLQYVTSLVGALITCGWALRAYGRAPAHRGGSMRRLLLLLGTALVGAAALIWLRQERFAGASVTSIIWLGFWMGVGGALWGVTVASLALRAREWLTQGRAVTEASGR